MNKEREMDKEIDSGGRERERIKGVAKSPHNRPLLSDLEVRFAKMEVQHFSD